MGPGRTLNDQSVSLKKSEMDRLSGLCCAPWLGNGIHRGAHPGMTYTVALKKSEMDRLMYDSAYVQNTEPVTEWYISGYHPGMTYTVALKKSEVDRLMYGSRRAPEGRGLSAD
ncbi:uncharacterized protein EI97DRAFT_444112 [Westerdykella ornata]|uniref:Uncharacterized protein n=1 Tax=Westerdykella ornata TaxID=318751 RepID=A0A6A6JDP3_WESOR|nr:uncharacterized protein EI97DRAFT_444112 [Westerdykella ornata]KAF2274354.1 hypothetical protein EI97DRAFT_444112 [Westerdykella ornata]